MDGSVSGRRPLIARRAGALQLSGIRKVFELAQTLPDVIRLEVGEPDFATPLHIRSATQDALERGGFTGYTSTAGYPELRRAIAAKMVRENGIEADPDGGIMVTAGASGALFMAIQALIDPGDEALLPDPGWPQYLQMATWAGATPVFYPLRAGRAFAPDLTELEGLITPRTKLILINSPSNPTGAVWDRPTIQGIANLARRHDLVVISDEVYERIVYDDAVHISIATLPGMFERTVTISGCSKTFAMTGWRIGYAVGPKAIISEMIKLQSLVYTCPSSVSQRAALAALTGSDEPVREMVAEYKRRRDWLVTALNQLPGVRCLMPGGAFYVFPDISSFGLSAQDFAMRLLQTSRVTSVPGTAFGTYGEGHIRFSYATSMERLHQALERIRQALPALRQAA
jgi:aspartate/methionine/tyrosine aminotransferase